MPKPEGAWFLCIGTRKLKWHAATPCLLHIPESCETYKGPTEFHYQPVSFIQGQRNYLEYQVEKVRPEINICFLTEKYLREGNLRNFKRSI